MALLLAMIAVMPFEKNPYLKISDNFLGIPEFTVIKALGIIGLLWAGVQLVQRPVPPHVRGAPQIRTFVLFVAGAFFVSILGGASPLAATRLVALALFLPLILAVVRTERDLRLVLGMSVVTLTLVFPYAYRQMMRYGGRLGVGLNEPNYTAVALLLVLPVTFVFLRQAPTPAARLGRGAALVAVFTQIILTASRGGFLGLVVGASLIAFRLTQRRVLTFSVIGGLLAVVIFVAPTSLGSRVIASIDPDVNDVAAQQSTKLRLNVIDAGLSILRDNPLVGVGLGNYKWAVAIHTGGEVAKIAHNTYLEIMVELGLPVALLFAAVLFVTFRSLRRAEKLAAAAGNAGLKDLLIAIQIGLAGYLVAATFISAQYEKFFWLFAFLTIPAEAIARDAYAKREA